MVQAYQSEEEAAPGAGPGRLYKQVWEQMVAHLGKPLNDDFKKYAPIRVNGQFCKALVDSGNLWRTCISEEMLARLGWTKKDLTKLRIGAVGTAKKGSSLKVLGETKVPVKIQFGDQDKKIKCKPVVVRGLTMEMNLSGPFLKQHQIDQLHSRGCLLVHGKEVGLVSQTGEPGSKEEGISAIYAMKKTIIPPGRVACLPVKVQTVANGIWAPGMGTITGCDEALGNLELNPGPPVDTLCLPEGISTITVVNLQQDEAIVPAGYRMGYFEKRPSINLLRPKTEKKEVPKKKWSDHEKDEWIIREFRLDGNKMLKKPKIKHAALAVLRRHWEVYSTDGSFGKTHLLKHEIHTDAGPPTKEKFRPINPVLEKELRKQLEEWLKHDVIEESTSPWSFALVAVRKKNGKWRWCVDYRKLNDRTKKDSFPLPNIDDNLARLAHSNVFSGIDGMGAFHVVELEETSKAKTAFATPWGSYQFKRMPFGLSNGPATYSRLMQLALHGISATKALPYLDDTIIHSNGMKRHLKNLDLVLAAHARAGLKLQPSKCQLFQPQIEYLGHVISKEGRKPIEEYVKVVKEWPLPTNKTQVRGFLGKVGYYSSFIPDYAKKAKPWTDVLGGKKETKNDKRTPIKVTKEMEEAFEEMKKALISAPVLAFPDFDSKEPMILDTDWSQSHHTIAAVLSQKQDGKERVIRYGAKKLNASQCNYSANKGELFAVIHFMKLFKYFLLHRKFILRTDHQALKWIYTMKTPNGLVSRWLDILADFQFEVVHRPGTQHGNADQLSRAPHITEEMPEDDMDSDEEETCIGSMQITKDLHLPRLMDEWRMEQQQDWELRQIRDWITNDSWPDEKKSTSLAPAVRHYWGLQGQLFMDNNGLLKFQDPFGQGKEKGVICIPRHLQQAVIKAAHRTTCHQGQKRTRERAMQYGYFPDMRKLVNDYVQSCLQCQKKGDLKKGQRHTFATVPDGYPFQRLSLDFVGPLPKSKRGNVMILTIKDTFSRWIEAFPIKAATAEAVAHTLEKEIFPRFGYPEALHSDRGTQFTGHLMRQVGKLLDLTVTQTPAYNPQSNPVERAHRDLKAIFRSIIDETGLDWEETLPQALFALRTATSRATGLSPFQLVFGRDPNIPLALMEQMPPAWEEEVPVIEYMERYRTRLEAVHRFARENMGTYINRQKQYYRQKLMQFPEGSLVWLYTPPIGPGANRKFHRGWTGPWEVTARPTPTVYKIKSPAEWEVQKEVVVAVNRLKAFYAPQQSLQDYQANDLTLEELERAWDPECERIPLSPPKARRAFPSDQDSDDEEDMDSKPPLVQPKRKVGRPRKIPQTPLRKIPLVPPRAPLRQPRLAQQALPPEPPSAPDFAPSPVRPPTIDTPWKDHRTSKKSTWQPMRPSTPGVRRNDPLPQLEPFPTHFSPSRNVVPQEATAEDSSDSEAEKELRRLTGVPLAKRRLDDSSGWKGAAADTRWFAREGTTTRAAARRLEQETIPGEPVPGVAPETSEEGAPQENDG